MIFESCAFFMCSEKVCFVRLIDNLEMFVLVECRAFGQWDACLC